jgi:hypothetical protein
LFSTTWSPLFSLSKTIANRFGSEGEVTNLTAIAGSFFSFVLMKKICKLELEYQKRYLLLIFSAMKHRIIFSNCLILASDPLQFFEYLDFGPPSQLEPT